MARNLPPRHPHSGRFVPKEQKPKTQPSGKPDAHAKSVADADAKMPAHNAGVRKGKK